MVVMDQFTRRIIGFAVHVGNVDGPAVFRMFNEIIAGQDALPFYLSSDQANLRILNVTEVKTVPYVPRVTSLRRAVDRNSATGTPRPPTALDRPRPGAQTLRCSRRITTALAFTERSAVSHPIPDLRPELRRSPDCKTIAGRAIAVGSISYRLPPD
jgi:hypothetical protein